MNMVWHKIQINFMLWCWAISDFGFAFNYITGSIYEYDSLSILTLDGLTTAKDVYASYSTLQAVDIAYGIAGLCIGIFTIIVRFRLARYKRNSPSLLNSLLIANIVSMFLYAVASTTITGTNTIGTILFAIGIQIALIIINTNYYEKRRHLFEN